MNLKLENVKAVHYGTESLSFLALKIQERVPLEIKSSQAIEEFKKKIKSCRLLKIYLHHMGFI